MPRRKPAPATMTVQEYREQRELPWQRKVEGYLKQTRLRWYHNDDSVRMLGNAAKGLPDIEAYDDETGFWLVAELKRGPRAKPTKEQREWLERRKRQGAAVYVWRPSDEDAMKAILRPYAMKGWEW